MWCFGSISFHVGSSNSGDIPCVALSSDAAELFSWCYGTRVRECLVRADLWEVLVEPILRRSDLTPQGLFDCDSRLCLTRLEQVLLMSRLAVDVAYLNRRGHRTMCQSPPCCESELKILDALSEAFASDPGNTREVLFANRSRQRRWARAPGFLQLWTEELTGKTTLATLAWYFSRHDSRPGRNNSFHTVHDNGRTVQFMFPEIAGLDHEIVGLKYSRHLCSQVTRFLAFLRNSVEALAASHVFTE